jgi:signal transduction histidine kinase/CheY-like chemotaxis protein
MLNPVAAWALFGALTSLFAAMLVAPLGRVPDWEDLRPLTWVALSAALMSAVDVTDTLDLAPAVHLWSNRLQVLAISLHILAWISYLPGWAKRPDRLVRWAWPLAGLGLLALVPGLVYGDGIRERALPWLGVVYRDPEVTPVGVVVWAIMGGYGVWALVRMALWSRSGAPYPVAHLASLGLFFVVVVHDAAVEAGVPLNTPYLMGAASVGMMVVFGSLTLRRVSRNGLEYHRLRASLETAVADRSRQLEESQVALARAERRAALGQFSAGVANEVRLPAAAVAANLRLLSTAVAADARPDVRKAIVDARSGLERIEGLARQLLLAGGGEGGKDRTLEPVLLADALRAALAEARARAEDRVAIGGEVPEAVWVLGNREPLVLALSNLLVNAVQAIPALRSGTVTVRGAALWDRVQIVVQDDGIGMSEEELRHVFEPFQGAKAPGQGSGLALAVARSLLEGMQGSLRFESAVGRGTQAIVELVRAQPADAGEAPSRTPPPPVRASLLVVDDDPDVLRSMGRLLGRQHQVRIAAGVKEALAAIEESDFDLVLCDVMMPGGGGERFWAELLVRRPVLMNRVVFMTGGVLTGEARAFMRRPPRPVLVKPFEVAVVNEQLARLGPRAARAPDAERSGTIGKLRR